MRKHSIECTITDLDDLDAAAYLNGRNVGHIWCLRDGNQLKIADIEVDETYRRKGIGGQLLRTILQAANKAGIGTVWGVITKDDLSRWDGLLGWYERFGFTVAEPDEETLDIPSAVKKIVRRR